jgi:gluconolactonase
MEDGANDEWNGAEFGNWWLSNLTMFRALQFAGYDISHTWSAGTDNHTHATAIFPEVARWLWRDYPSPIQAKPSHNRNLQAILLSEESWKFETNTCTQGDLISDADGPIYESGPDKPVPAIGTVRGKEDACNTSAGHETGIAEGLDVVFIRPNTETELPM